MTQIIQVSNLVKRYKKAAKNSVDSISFDVEEGSFFAFLGPNGAGKTTTISILTTTLSKTGGKITIAGYDLDKDQDKIRKEIGIIFQNPTLDLNLSAEENVRIHVALYGAYRFAPTFGLMPQEYKDRLLKLAELLELNEELKKPVKSYSGGMKRKLEILRALMHKPKILFLDEPTTGLDPVSRAAVWKYLKKMRQEEKITVFLTTHYLEEAEEADRVVILSKGKVVMDDTPDNIKEKLTDSKLLLVGSDQQKLEKEIKQFKYPYTFDGVRFTIDIDDHFDIQAAIKKIDTPLSSIRIHQPTLEEAYIKVIEE